MFLGAVPLKAKELEVEVWFASRRAFNRDYKLRVLQTLA